MSGDHPFCEAVLDEFYRQLGEAQQRRATALEEMARYDTDNPEDFDIYDQWARRADDLSDDIADIKNSIEELEDRRAHTYEREVVGWHQWSTR